MKQLVSGILILFLAQNVLANRPWQGPDFSGQNHTLGYQNNHGFLPTDSLRPLVKFWVDVYTKYSVNEGVIHQVSDLTKTYGTVSLEGCQTQKEKQSRIDRYKLAVVQKEVAAGRSLSVEDLRFQQGLKERMKEALFVSGLYIEKMEEIFEKEGLPKELIRIIYVESSFNIKARSKVGASGVWQIMPGTARPYKYIRGYVDLRNHPIEATKLAAKILKSNYLVLRNWPLAITAYNHGPTGIRRLTEEFGTEDLAELIEKVKNKKSFAFASKNFYPTFLAALEVEKKASQYFPGLNFARPEPTRDIKLPQAVSYKQLINIFGDEAHKLSQLNPHIQVPRAKDKKVIPAKTVLTVPTAKYNAALIVLSKRQQSLAAD